MGSDLALSTRVLVDTTLSLDDMVCREMEALKPDCIVADSAAAAVRKRRQIKSKTAANRITKYKCLLRE